MFSEEKYYEQVTNLNEIFHRRPQAVAILKGNKDYPRISGEVRFYQTGRGVVVAAEVTGLPVTSNGGKCQGSFFGFHIHTGGNCSGSAEMPFADALGHFNPEGCEHPYHAGDLPPLLGNNGYAVSAFLTDRFSVREILGRTVIVHLQPDDFHTQPSGNAGAMIACGVVRPVDKAA